MTRTLHKVRLQRTEANVATPPPLTAMSTTPLAMDAPNWLVDLIADKMGDPTVFDEPTVRMPTAATWARIAVTEPFNRQVVEPQTEPHQQVWYRIEG